jgi:NAD(P)H-quinone oxidoreductase subunit 5
VVLGLAWAPLLWLPVRQGAAIRTQILRGLWGLLMVGGLTATLLLAHGLPLGLPDAADPAMGMVAMAGMTTLYACLVTLHLQPSALTVARHWSYAGFYVDEGFTRLALRLWPARWTPDAAAARRT